MSDFSIFIVRNTIWHDIKGRKHFLKTKTVKKIFLKQLINNEEKICLMYMLI